MSAARRLVSTAEVGPPAGGRVSVGVRHELERADGTRLLLLDDRGWSSSGTWDTLAREDVERDARTVVGPDEPFGDRDEDDMTADHWRVLAQTAQRRGADVDADALRALPHDVELGPRLGAVVARARRSGPA